MFDNRILATMTARGASAATAAQDHLGPGIPASRAMARTDLHRIVPLKAHFEAAAEAHGVPPALLAAIASRETRGGAMLDENGFGDAGRAFGIMQIDRRFHTLRGLPNPRSPDHISQACAILAQDFARIQARFPREAAAGQLQAAVAAYNCGVGAVSSIATADARTTGRDYSADVWVRATVFSDGW